MCIRDRPISETFTELGIGFDAVYTGYLGSFKQLDFVNSFIERFKTKDTTVFIDPVMGCLLYTSAFYTAVTCFRSDYPGIEIICIIYKTLKSFKLYAKTCLLYTS